MIKLVQKGRTPALRHIHRTHRINLEWICETCQLEHIELKYVGTKAQIAYDGQTFGAKESRPLEGPWSTHSSFLLLRCNVLQRNHGNHCEGLGGPM
eukprot:9417614-Pyramimonas_sp.AAC.1